MDDLLEARRELARRPGPFGPGRRAALTAATDDWLRALFRDAEGSGSDIALIAVGSHGRAELAPGSDLDLVLVHRTDPARAARTADRIWYPVWDSGLRLDHSVRTIGEARRIASEDLKVVLGMLDARLVAGDPAVAEQLRSSVFGDWRAMADRRMPQLHELVRERRAAFGDVASLLEPNLKESFGGLREATILRAIAASWITDMPHTAWPAGEGVLLDVRDALHSVAGRAEDRLLLQEQDQVAAALGLPSADDLLRSVFTAARTMAYAAESTWHRVDRLTRRRPRRPLRVLRRPSGERVPLAEGVVIQSGEVVLAAEARPDRDPVLVLRAAAAAAQAGLPLAPHAVARLAEESAPMPRPWPRAAREAFISLLGAGPPLVGVWESLDQHGIIDALLPQWAVVRSAPQRNSMHRFTVDRHLVQTAVQAASLTRDVDRPDLLLVAALLHDIGKARPGDHSLVGAVIATDTARMMGFDEDDVAIIASMVRHHLLLADTATRRDIDDPATAALVIEAIGSHAELDLLVALTEADSIATGPAVWTEWRRRLIADLAAECHRRMSGRAAPVEPVLSDEQAMALAASGLWVLMEAADDVCTVTVAAPDRVGLLAAASGVLALHRLQVRAARVVTVGERAVQVWSVQPMYGEPPTGDLLAEDIRLALDGAIDIAGRLRSRDEAYAKPSAAPRPEPRVDVLTTVSSRATVLEVRAHDESGLLHRIASAVSAAGAGITGARVATLGSEVVDVFFLVDRTGAPLSDDHAAAVQVTVRACVARQVP